MQLKVEPSTSPRGHDRHYKQIAAEKDLEEQRIEIFINELLKAEAYDIIKPIGESLDKISPQVHPFKKVMSRGLSS